MLLQRRDFTSCGYCISKLDFAANSLPIYCISKLGKREVWPKIKPAINHGKPVYVVDARIAGTGERRFFQIKAEAEGWAQLQRVRRKNEALNIIAGKRPACRSMRPSGN